MTDRAQGETVENEYKRDMARRTPHIFSLTESELETMVSAPWWVRRRVAKRIRSETVFEDTTHD